MHFHHHTLIHLSRHFLARHRGEKILNCFSQNKNELVIELETTFLRIGCHTPQTFVVPVPSYAKARKNVVDLFEEVNGLTVTGSYVVPWERVLILELENDYQIILKMHGIMANAMLRHGGHIIALFNQKLEADWSYEEISGAYEESAISREVSLDEKEILTALRNISPIFEKFFARRVLHFMKDGQSFSNAYHHIVGEAMNDVFFLVKEKNKVKFYLFPPAAVSEYVQVQGIEDALQFYLRSHFQFESYLTQYKTADKEIRKPVKKYQKVYESYQKSIYQLENERNPEEIGHILMANLHVIESGFKKVNLEDFYQGEEITIKLDPQLNPQENAKRYYDKHKQRRQRLQYLKDQLDDIETKLLEAEEEYEQFQALVPPGQLTFNENGFLQEELKSMKQFSRQLRKEMKEADEEKTPFRTFKRGGYEIFVGRNARNNDELSFKFATKNDLWLHAKDVSGSHVVIRHRAGKDLPLDVLEYAAQLAAYYSKRKNDSLVPVLYTPRKYIRKRKGDPPGLVAVDREEVIMVEPIRE